MVIPNTSALIAVPANVACSFQDLGVAAEYLPSVRETSGYPVKHVVINRGGFVIATCRFLNDLQTAHHIKLVTNESRSDLLFGPVRWDRATQSFLNLRDNFISCADTAAVTSLDGLGLLTAFYGHAAQTVAERLMLFTDQGKITLCYPNISAA